MRKYTKNTKTEEINKLALGKKNTQKHKKTQNKTSEVKPSVPITAVKNSS